MVESHDESGPGSLGQRRRRVRRDALQWRTLIEQQRASGQSVKDFCAEHDLGEASFYAWRRHLRQQADQSGEAPKAPLPSAEAKESAPGSAETTSGRSQRTDDGRPGSNATGFVRLDAQADASSEAIEVQFACGASLRCSSSYLAELVHLLKVDAGEGGRC